MIESNNKKQYRRSAAKLKKQVLEEQGFRCIYCGCNLFPLSLKKPVFDHFVPWAFTANTSKENLIASCQECNSIKTDRCFKDLKEAREYILPRKKG